MKKLIATLLVCVSLITLAAPALADSYGHHYDPPLYQICNKCHRNPCHCYAPCKPPAKNVSTIDLVNGVSKNMKPCCEAQLYQVVHCKTDGLNVRKGPSTSEPIKVRVKNGGYLWVIKFVGECEDWAYVQYSNKRYGYVMTSYLQPVYDSE